MSGESPAKRHDGDRDLSRSIRGHGRRRRYNRSYEDHRTTTTSEGVDEGCFQRHSRSAPRQCCKSDMRIACDPHWQTPGPIKHPCRQFQPALPRSSLQRAAQNRAVYFLNRFMDTDDASGPGMPRIKNLALVPNLGTVGVTAPSCTIIGDRIKAAGALARPRCRPTLTHSP